MQQNLCSPRIIRERAKIGRGQFLLKISKLPFIISLFAVFNISCATTKDERPPSRPTEDSKKAAHSELPKIETSNKVEVFTPSNHSSESEVSKLNVGDAITYSYTGSYRKVGIRLTETVTEKAGLRLTILANFISGNDKRKWKMTVIDTPENRMQNKLESLSIISAKGEKVVTNENNKDLSRLFQGTMPAPSEAPLASGFDRQRVKACGREYDAEVTLERWKVGGRDGTMRIYESLDFPWINLGATLTDDKSGEVIYRAEVLGCVSQTGRKQ